MNKRIAIIGAGITGLTIAYELSKKGHTVTVYENAPTIGGLATTLQMGSTAIENIYHHIFTSDKHLIELAKELGLDGKLVWTEPKDAFYSEQGLFPFTSPMDLLKFKVLPFPFRVTMGLLVLRSRFVKNFDKLENMSAA